MMIVLKEAEATKQGHVSSVSEAYQAIHEYSEGYCPPKQRSSDDDWQQRQLELGQSSFLELVVVHAPHPVLVVQDRTCVADGPTLVVSDHLH